MGEFEWSLVNDRFVISERMAAITGLPSGSVRAHGGRAALDYIYPDDVSALAARCQAALAAGERHEARFRFMRPDTGRLIWVNISAVLVRGRGDRVEKVIGVLSDISQLKAEEDEVGAVSNELDHRIKNILDCIRVVATHSARRSTSLEGFTKSFTERLGAMRSAHTLLSQMRRRGAAIDYIADAELAGLTFGRAPRSGPAIVLTPAATSALGFALHELAANAVKFGALSLEAGLVDVVWLSTPDGGFELTWREMSGPPVAPPTHRGFGRGLLEDVTGRELDGAVRLDFQPEGLTAVITAGRDAVAELLSDRVGASDESLDVASAPLPPNARNADGPLDTANIANLRVLIVEDSKLLASELKRGLKTLRAKVIGAVARSADAEHYFKSDFDVAVLNADLNGQSVLPIVKALVDRDIPFVFTIGADDAAAAPKGFNAPIVRKPYSLGQMAAALSRAAGADAPRKVKRR